MTSYDIEKAHDYSPLAVHFTKERKFARPDLIAHDNPLHAVKSSTAKERLLSILRSKAIYASPMPWIPRNAKAVCFTECVWDSLRHLTERYSSFGIVVNKRLLFKGGGGPALYVRGDVMKKLGSAVPGELEPYIAPFDPDGVIKAGMSLDYLREREWRLPSDLCFEYADLEHVLVGSVEDAMDVVREIGAVNLPQKKVIPMDVYNSIKDSWGPW